MFKRALPFCAPVFKNLVLRADRLRAFCIPCSNESLSSLVFQLAFRRWLREFTEFFFQKGNALNLAIAVVMGTQFQQIVDALTKDLLMPLLNPLIRNGGWEKWVIPYAGGQLLIGQA